MYIALGLFLPWHENNKEPITLENFKSSASFSKFTLTRDMAASLSDVSYIDHIILRVEIIPAWTEFWCCRLQNLSEILLLEFDSSKFSEIISIYLNDILKIRLNDAEIPSAISNLLFSATGKCVKKWILNVNLR